MTKAAAVASVRDEALAILSRLGVPQGAFARTGIAASSPITGELIAHVRVTDPKEARAVIDRAAQAFDAWRTVPPAPRNGDDAFSRCAHGTKSKNID